ncbi:MAG: hypothetical protein JWR37_6126 [Mycobacterium sp.]|nr:hypothetical protein [Mycobacterium sp.]
MIVNTANVCTLTMALQARGRFGARESWKNFPAPHARGCRMPDSDRLAGPHRLHLRMGVPSEYQKVSQRCISRLPNWHLNTL